MKELANRPSHMDGNLSHRPSHRDGNLSHRPSHKDGNLSHRPSHADIEYMEVTDSDGEISTVPAQFWSACGVARHRQQVFFTAVKFDPVK